MFRAHVTADGNHAPRVGAPSVARPISPSRGRASRTRPESRLALLALLSNAEPTERRHDRPGEVRSRRIAHPEALVQHPGRPAEAAAAPASSGHAEAARARRSRAALSDGADRAGGHAGAGDPDPRAGARRLPPVAPVAALPRAAAREGARDPGADLLQVRGRLARRQPQAEHRGRAGVLQPRSRRQEARHRDRRRPVGLVARVRRRALRHRRADLHGPRVLRPEALPPRADGDLRRALHSLAVGPDAIRQGDPGEEPEASGLARHRDLRGGRGRRAAATTPNTRSARCSTTSSCTRRSSARRRWRRSRWRATTRTSSSAAPAAARTSPASRSRSSARSSAAGRRSASSRSSPPPARASRAASTPTTSATPRTSRRS